MGRKIRLFLEDTALHISIKSINQEILFKDDEDFTFYRNLLTDVAKKLHVSLHSYVFLPNQINFLATFVSADDASRFMQSLGLKYVSYYNKKYKRSGTLWEGRYKSSLVEDIYVLSVMQYIETLALNQKVVLKLQENEFSSFNVNALAQTSDLIIAHFTYEYLGKDSTDRASIYRSKLDIAKQNSEQNEFIENCLYKQVLTGSKNFYEKVGKIVGENLFDKKRGRPKKKKNQIKRNEMYSKLTVLDKEQHKSLKISPLENLNFAKEMAFVPVLANETAVVSEVFPVVFTADEKPSLVTLTSIGGNNLAINPEGKYITKYVPAFYRKYPFSLATKDENSEEKIVLIDEEASIVSKTKGKQLFTKDGEQSEALKNAIAFLTSYEQEAQNTLAVVKTISEAGILEDREISVGEGEEKKVLVQGFRVVNREKLNALSDEVLAKWVRKGIISFIDAHIKSLEKIEVLFKLANQNQ